MRFMLLITCMAIVVTGIVMVHSFVLEDGSSQKLYVDIKTSDVLEYDSGAEVTTAADTSKAPSVTIVTSSSTSSASTHISTVPQTTDVTASKSTTVTQATTTVPQATTTATVASTTAATTTHSTTPTNAYPRPPVGTMKPIDPAATYGYNAHDYLD